jgi:tRNA-specific 2-thiouridylase
VEASVKIRYRAGEAPAIVEPCGDAVHIRFHQPQRAVTPGQAAVFYQGDEVLGGGFIEAAEHAFLPARSRSRQEARV